MPKRNKAPSADPSASSESQAAEAATIGWMLCVLTATVCELGVVAARLYFAWHPDATVIGTAGELLLFASAIIGAVTLALIPVVYKARRVKPPTAVTAFVVGVGLIPWLILLRQLLS
jgi:hypothetical protein